MLAISWDPRRSLTHTPPTLQPVVLNFREEKPVVQGLMVSQWWNWRQNYASLSPCSVPCWPTEAGASTHICTPGSMHNPIAGGTLGPPVGRKQQPAVTDE